MPFRLKLLLAPVVLVVLALLGVLLPAVAHARATGGPCVSRRGVTLCATVMDVVDKYGNYRQAAHADLAGGRWPRVYVQERNGSGRLIHMNKTVGGRSVTTSGTIFLSSTVCAIAEASTHDRWGRYIRLVARSCRWQAG